MSESAGIIFAPPKSIRPKDVARIEERGMLVIFSDDWRDLKVTNPTLPISGDQAMFVAMKSVLSSGSATSLFGHDLAQAIKNEAAKRARKAGETS